MMQDMTAPPPNKFTGAGGQEPRHQSVETLVIGGGVIGASIAAELHRGGADVHVVDAGVPGEGVSGTSFAWVNSSAGKSPESYRMLNLRGLEAHHRLHQVGRAPWFHPTGMLTVTVDSGRADSADQTGSATSSVSDQLHPDLEGRSPREVLDRNTLHERFPMLPGHFTGGILYPRDGWVDTGHLIAGLLAELPHRHVRTATSVVSLRPRNDGQQALATLVDGSTIGAEQVVIAAGNGAPELLEQCAPGLVVLDADAEETNVGLTIETYPVACAPEVVVQSDGVAVRPTRKGGVMIADHATAAAHGISDPALWTLPTILMERARALLPGLGMLKANAVRVSPRVWPRDGLTTAGWIAEGIYTVLTHSGVTLAPYLAQSTASELAGTAVSELDGFRPERFWKLG